MRRCKMSKRTGLLVVCAVLVVAALAAFFLTRGDQAALPETAALGPSPTLPDPTKTVIPTVHIAPAKGWSEGAQPKAASDLAVNAFATGLSHPRWLYVLPNGDVLVAEADGPPRPEDAKGIKGFIYRMVQKRAGVPFPTPEFPSVHQIGPCLLGNRSERGLASSSAKAKEISAT
jgi:glucose/arabinose dehydrogenase